LEFHSGIVEKLVSQDALLIMARGLGIQKVITAMIKLYLDSKSNIINNINSILLKLDMCCCLGIFIFIFKFSRYLKFYEF